MAIEWFRPVGGDTGTISGNSAQETMQFLAKSTIPNEKRVVIYTHRNCPKRYQQHPDAPGLFCESVTATRRREKYVWDVSALFVKNIEDKDEPENPLERRAKVRFRGALEGAFTTYDGKGKAMLNLAGEPFAPQEDYIPGGQIVVTKNIPPVFPSWLLRYLGAVNSDAVRLRGIDFPADTLRIMDIDLPDDVTEGKVTYIPMTISMQVKVKGWFWRPLNEGFHELVEEGDGKEKRRILERIRNGPEYPTTKTMLDRNGRAYRDVSQLEGEQLKDPNIVRRQRLRKLKPEEIIELKFERGERLPFSALPLK